MKKFKNIYTEVETIAEIINKQKILADYEKIYESLLERWNVISYNQLDENSKKSFDTELSLFWNINNGLSKKGQEYLKEQYDVITKNSTDTQKSQYIAKRINTLAFKIIQESNLKDTLYNAINDIYINVEGNTLKDVLSPDQIDKIVNECFNKQLNIYLNPIKKELNESYKINNSAKINESSSAKKTKFYLKKK